MHVAHLLCYEAKLTNLKLKTWPEQLYSYLMLSIETQISKSVWNLNQEDKTLTKVLTQEVAARMQCIYFAMTKNWLT